jgi:hypothetical protein
MAGFRRFLTGTEPVLQAAGIERQGELIMRAAILMAAAGLLMAAAGAPAELNAQGRPASVTAKQQAKQQARQQAGQADRQQQIRDAERAERDRATARERERRERERLDRERRERERLDRGRRERDRGVLGGQQARGRGGSPAFCRSGAGHPVFGRQWCDDKGFGLGSQRWDRARWEDVVLGQPQRRGRLDRSGLGDVLGDVVLGRLHSYGRRHGSGALSGTWLDEAGAAVLQLSVGSTPFARLIDVNRNGRVDTVLLRR